MNHPDEQTAVFSDEQCQQMQMPKPVSRYQKIIGICSLLILIAWLCRLPAFSMDRSRAGWILSLLRSGIYIGLFTFWGFSVQFRIIQTQVRHFLMGIAALMVFWMVVRTLKYQFVSTPDIQRFLWYCFYVPQIYIPLMAMYAALSLGRPEDYRLPGWISLLHIPALALILLVLSNDMHQLVFSFPLGSHMMENGQYVHESGYFLVLFWTGACTAAVFTLLVLRSRIPESKHRIWQPLLPLVLLVLYGILYLLNSSLLLHYLGDMTAVVCILIVLIFESCFQCGLIQTNSYYGELFQMLSMPAAVLKNDGTPVYVSRNMPDLLPSQIEEAGDHSVETGQDLLLRRYPLKNGQMLWVEDVHEIRMLQKELREQAAALQEESDLLEAEISLKEKQAVTEVRSALYERAARELAAPFEEMNRLLVMEEKDEESFRRILPRICVLGAYVKRRCNMIILNAEHTRASADLLYHALRESADCLEICGVSCLIRVNSPVLFDLRLLMLAYDVFEQTARLCLNHLDTLAVLADIENHVLTLKIQAETFAPVPDLSQWQAPAQRAGGFLQAEKEDSLLYIQLVLPEECP